MKKYVLSAAALAMGLTFSGLARADINVAVVGPLTGAYASFGEQMKAGAELAVEDINAAGGVLGKKLKLFAADDACDPKQAVSVANKLAGEQVVFVAGHFCSGSSIPASAVYAEENMVQISPASTNPKFTDERPGDMIFRVCGRDDQQGSVAGAYLKKNFGDKRIAIIHDKQAYSKGLADETRKAMNAAGKKEEMYETVTPGEKDYNALVSKLKQARIGQHRKGLGQQTVAGQDRGRLVELLVHGRTAPAQVAVIHGRKVVVHQAVAVDHLDRSGRAQGTGRRYVEQAGALDHQEGPKALAAAHH